MKITVIGAGNSGLIHAAKLIEDGNEVVILKSSYNGNNEFYNKIKSEGRYYVTENHDVNNKKQYSVEPVQITHNAKFAINHAEIIFVMTTVSQHENVAKLISPYVRDGQIIVLCPSYMSRFIFQKYIKACVTYSEWETTAYNGRIVNDEYVNITFYNPRNACSIYPIENKEYVINILYSLFSNTKYLRKNSLETAFHNPNMIVHPIGVVLSASRIEFSKGEFWMYREAFTPSVINVINKFDDEKNKILKEVGCEPLSYFEAAKWRNVEDLSIDAMDSFKFFADSSNKGPTKLRHRYLLEDVPMGLVLLSSIGKVLNIETTIADSIIGLASALLQKDFISEGRKISDLLENENLSPEELISKLNE